MYYWLNSSSWCVIDLSMHSHAIHTCIIVTGECCFITTLWHFSLTALLSPLLCDLTSVSQTQSRQQQPLLGKEERKTSASPKWVSEWVKRRRDASIMEGKKRDRGKCAAIVRASSNCICDPRGRVSIRHIAASRRKETESERKRERNWQSISFFYYSSASSALIDCTVIQ